MEAIKRRRPLAFLLLSLLVEILFIQQKGIVYRPLTPTLQMLRTADVFMVVGAVLSRD